ncbi:MAG: hypothetical protein C4331_13320 [Meiothermus sp.]
MNIRFTGGPMQRPPAQVILGSSLLIPLLTSTLLYIFAWPAVNTKPHHLPLGFVTTPTLEHRLPRLLNQIQENGFEPHFYPSEADARTAIQRREVYGTVLINPATPSDFTLLTASAASPTVAQLLTGLGNSLGTLLSAAGFSNPKVNDVVAATTSDPRQAGLASSFLPLIVKTSVATAEVDIDTLAERLREATQVSDATIKLPDLVSAWACKAA